MDRIFLKSVYADGLFEIFHCIRQLMKKQAVLSFPINLCIIRFTPGG